MVDIGRATRVREKEIKGELDKMEMVEALRHGNIYEVFAKSKTFKISDFQDFFSDQWRSFKGQIVQDAEIKASEGSYHEPDINRFPIHHRNVAINSEEGGLLSQDMCNYALSPEFKAEVTTETEAGSAKTGEEGVMTAEELEEMARGTIGDWESFLSDTWSQIMDAQMMSDYTSRMSEIKKEVDRIVALAKRGAVGVEFVLIAMAKVNATKNGVLMTWLGKKAFHINESLTKIANDLHTLDPATDPRYTSELQLAQSRSRDGAFQLQLLQTDMQKVMQDMAGTLEQVHGIMGEINRVRREIITKVAAH